MWCLPMAPRINGPISFGTSNPEQCPATVPSTPVLSPKFIAFTSWQHIDGLWRTQLVVLISGHGTWPSAPRCPWRPAPLLQLSRAWHRPGHRSWPGRSAQREGGQHWIEGARNGPSTQQQDEEDRLAFSVDSTVHFKMVVGQKDN